MSLSQDRNNVVEPGYLVHYEFPNDHVISEEFKAQYYLSYGQGSIDKLAIQPAHSSCVSLTGSISKFLPW